jgi:hypothetical protein
MTQKQFNLKTCHLFKLAEIEELEYNKQDYIDETIDALFAVASNPRNPENIRATAKTKFRYLAKLRNAEVMRSDYWNLSF